MSDSTTYRLIAASSCFSGSGLGLAISKNIIESFGGKIYFKSQEGMGTTFYVELPKVK